MASNDDIVRLNPATTNTGPAADVSDFTNSESLDVKRQRIAIGDAANFGYFAAVSSSGGLRVDAGNGFAPLTAPGTSASQTITIQGAPGAVPVPISGNLAFSGPLPAGTNLIGGHWLVDAAGTNKAAVSATGAVKVDGSNVTQPISGSVSISSLPSISGNINIVDGTNATYKLAVDSTGRIAVNNFPSSFAISSLPALPTGSNAIGSVTVTNTASINIVDPTTPANKLAINNAGQVSIANFPTTFGITSLPALPSGTNAIGSVSVSNFPTTQTVTGSVSISNFPSTQTVTGSVAISTALPTGTNTIGSVSLSAALPTGSNSIGAVTLNGWNYAVITQSGLTVVKNQPGVLGYVLNVSNSALSCNAQIYDNASAASGNLVFTMSTMEAMDKADYGDAGLNCATGISINCNSNPNGALLVAFR